MDDSAKKLDQFFTQDEVAARCLSSILAIVKQLEYDLDKIRILEPSAGDGAFIRAADSKGIGSYAYDIDAKQSYIKQNDFIDGGVISNLPGKDKLITVGNPPFGKRAKLAVSFINKAFEYSDTVAFILPLQFEKYSAQKQINDLADLVYSEKLDENSFLFQGENYSVRCCLQIWTKRKGLTDIRLRQAPQIKHPDFEMWQYNNTRGAEKYFDKLQYGWDFAVPRQGYKDYTLKETDPDKMDRRTQWIFFKANSRSALDNLNLLDFSELSRKNTSTPGFGKADVVQAYIENFGNHSSITSIDTQTFQLGDPRPSLAGTLPTPGIL